MLNRLHGGNVWQFIKHPCGTIIDFSASINPLRLPLRTKKIIRGSIDKLAHYPEPASESFKKALAACHGIHPENLLVSNGSIEPIYLIPRALKPATILIPVPSFTEYEFAARANGCKVLFVRSTEKDNFKTDLGRLEKFAPGADLIFLCNPNNPTGSLLSREELLHLLGVCKKTKSVLVIDEAFMDFVPQSRRMTLIREAVRCSNLLILRSLTKFFAFAGIRLGYVVGHRRVISAVSRLQYPWNVNSLAQLAGESVINDGEYAESTRRLIPREREYLSRELRKTGGITVYPSLANFLLCKLNGSRVKSSTALCKKTARKGILIRNCNNFRGLDDRFFRVAVRTRKENAKLISVIKSAVT